MTHNVRKVQKVRDCGFIFVFLEYKSACNCVKVEVYAQIIKKVNINFEPAKGLIFRPQLGLHVIKGPVKGLVAHVGKGRHVRLEKVFQKGPGFTVDFGTLHRH